MGKITLDDRIIKQIGWCMEPDFHTLEVGEDGITHFDCFEQYCGEYSTHWIQVWKGDQLVARYNARNIDSIIYFEED